MSPPPAGGEVRCQGSLARGVLASLSLLLLLLLGLGGNAVAEVLTPSMTLASFFQCYDPQVIQAGTTLRHWRVAGLTGAPSYTSDAAENLDADFSSKITPLMYDLAYYFSVGVWVVDPPSTLRTIFGGQVQRLGTGGATPLPTQTCGLLSLYSNYRGRKGQGREYLPFPSYAGQDAAFPKPSAAYKTAASALGVFLTTRHTYNNASGDGTFDLVPCPWPDPAGGGFIGVAICGAGCMGHSATPWCFWQDKSAPGVAGGY